MPFIRDERRKVFDPFIDKLTTQDMNAGELSYILLKIITDVTTRDVEDVIMTMGILEDVKATFRKYRYDNMEESKLFERWLVRDGDK